VHLNSVLTTGLAGSLIGILGGIIGTYFSITKTKTLVERRFMMRTTIWMWLGISIFLLVVFFAPSPWRWLAFIPYIIILTLSILYVNHRQQAFRKSELNS